MKKTALVIFSKCLSRTEKKRLQRQPLYDVVVSSLEVREDVATLGRTWASIEEYIVPGSIYEASALADELSRVMLPNGTRVTKSFMYEGFELWWIHYDTLFLNLCVPCIRYKALLEYLKEYQVVHIQGVPCNQNVFSTYLTAYGCIVQFLNPSRFKIRTFFPVGILIQIFFTFVSLPLLMVLRRKILVFTGDKFAKGGDYDFRMEFIYKELRSRNISFVESIRSLEPWTRVVSHACVRKRLVIYATAITFLARYISILTKSHHVFSKQFSLDAFQSVSNPEERFKLLLATRYLATAHYDMWEIRLSRMLLKLTGIKAAFVAAANERNFHTVIACKLCNIPTVGILHGSASLHYNVYDFMPSYDGVKKMSVDIYGLWSEWWKEYYSTNSRAYHREQLHVSGLMRPYDIPPTSDISLVHKKSPLRVLFVSEQLAVPSEVLPYLERVLEREDMEMYLVFRPYRDEFETWLTLHRKDILLRLGEGRILRNGIKEALTMGDVIVGSHSTAVLESLFQKKPFVFFETKKWGDYFSLRDYSREYSFYARSPEEFTELILKSALVPVTILEKLQNRFFGDPYKNGSTWVVDELVAMTLKNRD